MRTIRGRLGQKKIVGTFNVCFFPCGYTTGHFRTAEMKLNEIFLERDQFQWT